MTDIVRKVDYAWFSLSLLFSSRLSEFKSRRFLETEAFALPDFSGRMVATPEPFKALAKKTLPPTPPF